MDFIIGFIFGMAAMALCWFMTDTYASSTYRILEIGEKACAEHGGLKSYGSKNDFVCINGVEISNFKFDQN